MKAHLKKSDGVDPRESMRVFPKWMQPLLTELTGKPLPEEEMSFRWLWWMRLALAWLVLMGSIAASSALVTAGPVYWLLLPVTWLFTVSGLRAFQTTFVHHASHDNLSGRARLDEVLGEFMSTVAWSHEEPPVQSRHARLVRQTENTDLSRARRESPLRVLWSFDGPACWRLESATSRF